MWEKLFELLDRAPSQQILVVGDFMLDRYLYGDAERISPEAPVPVLRIVNQEEAVGGAGSVAADIAALGATAHCVGIVGRDPNADRLVEKLQSARVNPQGLVRVDGRPTTLKTRLVGLAQHRHRQQLIRVDDESSEPLDDATTDLLITQIEERISDCSALCIEDYNKGVITPRLAAAAVKLAQKAKIPVLVDPASISDYSRYRGATIITPNRTETEKLIGARLRSVAAVEKVAAQILKASCCEYVCVTLDADGAALIGPGGSFIHVPTKKRDVYDVTGAGDEVLAALAVGLAAGGTYEEAIALANVAGGLEVEKFGCVPVAADEIRAEILLEHHQALGKVRTLDQLLPELTRRRKRGERVAFTNGCFDILHVGHVATFSFSKEHAEIVIVGLNADESVRRLEKGSDRPIVSQDDRAAVLAALSDIDYVVIFSESTPQKLIESIQPDFLIKGEDWRGKPIAGQSVVESRGGKILFAPFVQGHSSTQIIDRIRKPVNS